MLVTVAICTFNPRPELLRRALDAIAPQLDDAAELVLVDNNSTPPVGDVLDLSVYPLRVVDQPVPGLTAAREAAIEAARGELIVFVDDDNILGDGYVATARAAFEADAELSMLGGAILPEYQDEPPAWLAEFEGWLAIRRLEPGFEAATTAPPYTELFPIGAGLAVRRDVAVAYLADCATSGEIQGRRGQALSSGEDVDMALFALSTGKKLMVTSDLRLTHVIPPGRVTPEYLGRLAEANVRSTLELEQKWSPRFGVPVCEWLYSSLPALVVKAGGATVLGVFSPRYRVKRRVFTARLGQHAYGSNPGAA